jgi:pimeloyl-ACP methyl ester carboxylesterase
MNTTFQKAVVFAGLCIASLLVARVVEASTELNGETISGDVHFTKAESPYVISGWLTVPLGSSLTIDKGAILKFYPKARIKSYGAFNAIGTASEPIIFASIYDSHGIDVLDDCGYFIEDSVIDSEPLCTNTNIYDAFLPSSYEWGPIDIDTRVPSLMENIEVYNINLAITAWNNNLTIRNAKVRNGTSAFLAFNGSNLSVSNADLKDVRSDGILAFNSSKLSISSTTIAGMKINDAIAVYGSSLAADKLALKDNNDGAIGIYGSSAHIRDSEIVGNKEYGLELYTDNRTKTKSTTTLERVKVSGFDYGIGAYSGALRLVDTDISGNKNGIDAYYMSTTSAENSTIKGNNLGVSSFGTKINLENVWWGDATGPYNQSSNPAGKGNAVSENVDFEPWLAALPIKAPAEPPVSEATSTSACCSSIAFIPGLQASRLYKKNILREDQLWEPNFYTDVTDLFLDENGESIDPSIYTRDALAKVDISGTDIYDSFFKFLNGLRDDEKIISSWKALPYDWRFGLAEITGRGMAKDDTISFTDGPGTAVASTTVPFMMNQLEELRKSSKNGKITLVAHSYGGLVTKYLLEGLEQMKKMGSSSLIDAIDKVILIAVPELGTPKALAALLHGYDQGLLKGFLVGEGTMRDLGEHMKSAFNLLPSAQYLEAATGEKVIAFSSSTEARYKWNTLYGGAISTFDKLAQFLRGDDGVRQEPLTIDTSLPNVVAPHFIDETEALHGTLDAWKPPAGIKVIEIAGWGLPTLSGMDYEMKPCTGTKNGCSDGSRLTLLPRFTEGGDRTVVGQSALSGIGEKLYLDLVGDNLSSDHATIVRVPAVHTFIKNEIQTSAKDSGIESDSLPKGLSTEPPRTKKNINFIASVHSPVSVVLTDSKGNRTGVRDDIIGKFIRGVDENVPHSFYMEFGDGKYVGAIGDDEYTIDLQGTDIGTFTFIMERKTYEDDGTEIKNTEQFIDLPVTPSMQAKMLVKADGENVLQIDVNGDGVVDKDILARDEFDPIAFLELLRTMIVAMDTSPHQVQLIAKIDHMLRTLANTASAGESDNENEKKSIEEYLTKIKYKFLEFADKHEGRNKPKKFNEEVMKLYMEMLNEFFSVIE